MALSGSPVCFSMEPILSEQVGSALSAAGTAPPWLYRTRRLDYQFEVDL